MNALIALSSGSLLALAAGCAAPRAASIEASDNVLAALSASYASTPELALHGTVKSSAAPVTVWFDALVRQRDSMKVVLNGPFGIPVGAMSSTPERFLFYSAEADEAFDGHPDRRTFEKLLMIPLDFDELVSLLRGEVPQLPEPGAYAVRSENGLLVYHVVRETVVEQIAVDPVGPAVVTYRRAPRADTSHAEIVIDYSGFAAVGSRRMARRASVDISGGSQHLNVALDEISMELPAGESLEIEIPANTPLRHM